MLACPNQQDQSPYPIMENGQLPVYQSIVRSAQRYFRCNLDTPEGNLSKDGQQNIWKVASVKAPWANDGEVDGKLSALLGCQDHTSQTHLINVAVCQLYTSFLGLRMEALLGTHVAVKCSTLHKDRGDAQVWRHAMLPAEIGMESFIHCSHLRYPDLFAQGIFPVLFFFDLKI